MNIPTEQVERCIFHENTHKWLHTNFNEADAAKLVNDFWREAERRGLFPKLSAAVSKEYVEEEQAEELFVEAVARSMSLGKFDAINEVLSTITKGKDTLNNILDDFGYEQEKEIEARRANRQESEESATTKETARVSKDDASGRGRLGLKRSVDLGVDDTSDVWSDMSLGLDERITAAATRLANNHRDNKTLRDDAMRAIGGNLMNLRRAMSLQRKWSA